MATRREGGIAAAIRRAAEDAGVGISDLAEQQVQLAINALQDDPSKRWRGYEPESAAEFIQRNLQGILDKKLAKWKKNENFDEISLFEMVELIEAIRVKAERWKWCCPLDY